MPVPLSEYLQNTINTELPHLRAMSDGDAAMLRGSGWTCKEELGHLIDSATNNHARFVCATLTDGFRGPSYDQNGWVSLHGYQEMPWNAIIDFWHSHNSMIARLIARIPEERLGTMCEVGTSGPVTLRFLIEDYVVHMQHHIDHALGRERVTQYPQANTASHK